MVSPHGFAAAQMEHGRLCPQQAFFSFLTTLICDVGSSLHHRRPLLPGSCGQSMDSWL